MIKLLLNFIFLVIVFNPIFGYADPTRGEGECSDGSFSSPLCSQSQALVANVTAAAAALNKELSPELKAHLDSVVPVVMKLMESKWKPSPSQTADQKKARIEEWLTQVFNTILKTAPPDMSTPPYPKVERFSEIHLQSGGVGFLWSPTLGIPSVYFYPDGKIKVSLGIPVGSGATKQASLAFNWTATREDKRPSSENILVSLAVTEAGLSNLKNERDVLSRLAEKHSAIWAKPDESHESLIHFEKFLDGTLTSAPAKTHAEKIEIAKQLLRQLQFLKDTGIIHRDIKPDNIMIEVQPDGSRKAVLKDFDISQFGEDVGDSRDYAGSPVYSHPLAQIGYSGVPLVGLPAAKEKADVWSLGVSLYEMLNGYDINLDRDRKKLVGCRPDMSVKRKEGICGMCQLFCKNGHLVEPPPGTFDYLVYQMVASKDLKKVPTAADALSSLAENQGEYSPPVQTVAGSERDGIRTSPPPPPPPSDEHSGSVRAPGRDPRGARSRSIDSLAPRGLPDASSQNTHDRAPPGPVDAWGQPITGAGRRPEGPRGSSSDTFSAPPPRPDVGSRGTDTLGSGGPRPGGPPRGSSDTFSAPPPDTFSQDVRSRSTNTLGSGGPRPGGPRGSSSDTFSAPPPHTFSQGVRSRSTDSRPPKRAWGESSRGTGARLSPAGASLRPRGPRGRSSDSFGAPPSDTSFDLPGVPASR